MKRSSVIFALCTTILLSGCVAQDVDLVLDFVNTWMESRGVLSKDKDGNYKPTLKALGVATGFSSTGDDAFDASVQAGKVVKDIKVIVEIGP